MWLSVCGRNPLFEPDRVWNDGCFISRPFLSAPSEPQCNGYSKNVFPFSVISIIDCVCVCVFVCVQVVRAKERLEEELSIQTQQEKQQNTETWSMKWCSSCYSSPHPL